MPKKTKVKAKKIKKGKAPKISAKIERATIISSEVVYQGPLFRILHDKLIEPGGRHNERDVIRHNGSVVILAVDESVDPADPIVIMERQYRHAAGQFFRLSAKQRPLQVTRFQHQGLSLEAVGRIAPDGQVQQGGVPAPQEVLKR